MDILINKLFPIQAIGPGLCLLHKNRYVAVLEAIPVNFAMRSDVDQERMVSGYANFLNGLSFPVQIFVRSETLRVNDYLADLVDQTTQMEPSLRPALDDYLQFIKESVTVHRLIKRHFYLVLSWISNDFRKPLGTGEPLWDEAAQELLRRQELIAQGLMALGIRVNTLDQAMMLKFLHASFGREQPSTELAPWS
ncbi:MAG: type VI secretion protein [Sulfobacillus thermotolerans]|uniref:Type VI secretion protein n=1 Tax=Sulfobacillus thermotolerans TaxID=338644 RepID=A0ABM6RRJ5_9FIRM|nr:type VI secretion protein [Sulfobacillus thermotolerans]MCY0907958.1 type VI secretion protein [Sulfobacillus thermotolerans]